MNNSTFSMTLRFFASVDYRRFISYIRRIPSLRAPYLGTLQGMARISVRRTNQHRELMLQSNSSLFDVLFDLRRLILPQTIRILDFSTSISSDPFIIEFDRSLRACVNSSMLCFENLDDPETFHRFRLDVRAFRSLLKIAVKLKTTGLDELRMKTREIAKATNLLRDADVRIGLYEKFNESIPESLIQERKSLLEDATNMLKDCVAEMEFIALQICATGKSDDQFEHKFLEYLRVQAKKTAKVWRKINLQDDIAIHALRIRMKLLTYGYNQRKENDESLKETAKSIKIIQSRLGDVRDLRAFYRLPGLDPETRYRAVQKLSAYENELKKLEIV